MQYDSMKSERFFFFFDLETKCRASRLLGKIINNSHSKKLCFCRDVFFFLNSSRVVLKIHGTIKRMFGFSKILFEFVWVFFFVKKTNKRILSNYICWISKVLRNRQILPRILHDFWKLLKILRLLWWLLAFFARFPGWLIILSGFLDSLKPARVNWCEMSLFWWENRIQLTRTVRPVSAN